jgi:HemY protein
MRLLIITLLVLVGASMLTALALEKPGFVLIGYDKTSIEIALFDFVLLLIAAFVAFYLLLRFLVRLVVMPAQLRKSYQRHQVEKAHKLFYRGLLELAEGHWTRAERLLVRSVWRHETPVMGYLGAARAAQMQAAYERRDEYLKRAIESDRSAGVAVGLLQAELQLSSQQKEQALATLQHLREQAPKHGYVLYMLARMYRSLAEWDHLLGVLPVLRKSRAIPTEQIDEVEGEAVAELMGEAGHQGDSEGVQRLWKRLPRRLKQDPSLAESHIRALEALGQHEQAVTELRRFLNTAWDEGLVSLLGELTLQDPLQILGQAESWLKEHGESPVLLLTLGKLALKAELWGKARVYLESAIAHEPDPEAYGLLAQLLERMGELDKAHQAYREGLGDMLKQKALPVLLPQPPA